jgi:hypothetical protein
MASELEEDEIASIITEQESESTGWSLWSGKYV